MKVGQFVVYPVLVGLMSIAAGRSAIAQTAADRDHDHAMTSSHQGPPSAQQNALVKVVRDATARFRDPAVANAEGYFLQFGCVSGSDLGAMGMHFVNGSLVGDGEVDAAHPEIVLYEPIGNGRVRLTGADYLVIAADWNAKHTSPPELMGQLFHLFDSPNRFGLPAFYTLHVWAWKDNPNGTFTNWNPDVSCDAFNPTVQ
jgi:hypothetical protein